MMLTAKDLKSLKQLLALADDQGCEAFTLNELLGYFYGLAITPEIIVPSEWLAEIFGEEMPEFGSEKQAKRLIDTMFRVFNEFSNAFHNGELAFPYNMAEPEDWMLEEVKEWTWGFQKALLLRPECWLQEEDIPLLSGKEEKESMASLAIITAIAEPESASEIFENVPEAGEDDDDFWASLFVILPTAVQSLQQYAAKREKARRDHLQETRHLGKPIQSIKIGRNDPCPCGSGKKYKKCCLKGKKVVPLH